jgi:DNA-binding NtrC family response regulator
MNNAMIDAMIDAPGILVVEDDPILGPAIVQRLRLEGFAPRLAGTGAGALGEVRVRRPLAIVSDIRLPDMSGEEVYRQVVAEAGALPVFFMTAFGDIAQAVRLMKAGARDYLTKPVDVDALVAALRGACGSAPAEAGTRSLGVSQAMRALEATLAKAARVDVPVLLLGETGVGKEVAAQFLHARSARPEAPFVAVNCAAIPRDLVESTLFGHEKGAFTGALARNAGLLARAEDGTLFLDEIGELPVDLQAKLLRAVQERTFLPVGAQAERRFSARLVCATHADLAARVAEGSFRADLYYRINVIELVVPPLRERPEDISWLARRFLAEAAGRFGTAPKAFSAEALDGLAQHDWPGNIRELRNRIERAVVLSELGTIALGDLFPEMSLDERRPEPGAGPLDTAVAAVVRTKIEEALRQAGGNRSEAAKLLGVSRTTLWKRMREFGL